MATLSTQPVIEPSRVAKLMQVIGICLFQYQQIEALLKLLLPHMRHPDRDGATAGSLNWRELIDSKVTLGPMVEDFKMKSDASNPQGFAGYLEGLVKQRNDLVHHILSDPNRPLASELELEAAISQVRQYAQSATPFLEALRSVAAQFDEALGGPSHESRFLATLELPAVGEDTA